MKLNPVEIYFGEDSWIDITEDGADYREGQRICMGEINMNF